MIIEFPPTAPDSSEPNLDEAESYFVKEREHLMAQLRECDAMIERIRAARQKRQQEQPSEPTKKPTE